IILIVCLSAHLLYAQQSDLSLLSSAGEYFENGQYSISWSLGELAIETFSQTGNILTQGFQQTKLSIVSVREQNVKENHLTIYPNPAVNELFLTSESDRNTIYLVQIFDMIGAKKLEQKMEIGAQKSLLKLNNLKAGTYMLVFKTINNEIDQTFLFQKVDL
ncbi:MAG: T9SS type A sorting domain-containing protein, partial [Chlorobi bacterium]|nr:T9SS type A sorting domain-containing protein [Chlorobiota bacterium]